MMFRLLLIFTFLSISITAVQAQSFILSAYPYTYSNNTLYVDVKCSIESSSDICDKIKVYGLGVSSMGSLSTVNLYYYVPTATHSVPTNCIVSDTIAISPVSSVIKQVDLYLHKVTVWDSATIDTAYLYSVMPMFLPLTISKSKVQSDISLYPNPAENMFFIEGLSKATTITIYDIFGKEVYHIEDAVGSLPVNISSFSSGMYLVVLNSSGYIEKRTLIKQ